MTTYFSAKELLEPPTGRAAFSDRQAYVCAELSKLAYFKFEGGHTLEQALGIVKDILGDDKRLALLEEQLRIVLSGAPSSAAAGTAALGKILQDVGFELAATFSTEGTRAFLCTRKVKLESGTDKVLAFLVFRGTEPKDFRDIKTDVKAALRKIDTVDVQDKLKTPVYEIVNEIDIVPRLPNPWMTTGMVALFRLFRLASKLFTVVNKLLASGTWDERLEAFIESMTRYRHPGYVSYLVGTGTKARLRFNVDSFDRFRWWFSMMWKRRIWQFDKMVTDHSIDEYIAKLRTNALNRQ